MQLRSIDIDFDVHRAIELSRTGFDESPNAVLRKLLGLDKSATEVPATKATGRSWLRLGVELPHGTMLRMSYNGSTYSGEVVDGTWLVEGGRHTTPSSAATAVAKTRSGKQTNLNGWSYWEAKVPDSASWVPLQQLWNEANAKK